MRKRFLIVILSFFTAFIAHAQYSRQIIEFSDKKGTGFSISNPAAYLSAKAVERRTRQKISIDSTDLPVTAAYIQTIAGIPGVKILSVSKWLNQVAVEITDAAALDQIKSLSFVKNTAPAAAMNKASRRKLRATLSLQQFTAPQPAIRVEATLLSYGSMFSQVHMHNGEYLHNLGFTGEGMTIAVIDGGFLGYKSNPAFDSLRLQNRVLGEWDFVKREASVNEDDAHGMYCLSVMAANRPGLLVGTAPRAKYYLYRTEDVSSEYPIEEQYWAAAAERADSVGVDMISSSLGYADFDDPSMDHSYASRDGNTTIITRAADLAAKKGILVMNSAGNSGGSGNELKYVACPADGDSVIAVGATDINGNIAGFSSWGPNGNGNQKPDMVSLGVGTTISDLNGNPATNNGTSFANPNLAGLIACLWQAFSEFNNMEIADAVKRSADKYDAPDNRYGTGIPDFKKASDILMQWRAIRNQSSFFEKNWLNIYPVPYQPSTIVFFKAPASGQASLRLLDATGKMLETKSIAVTADGLFSFQFDLLHFLPKGIYFVQYHDGTNKKTISFIK